MIAKNVSVIIKELGIRVLSESGGFSDNGRES
jgi:hypothetical protein